MGLTQPTNRPSPQITVEEILQLRRSEGTRSDNAVRPSGLGRPGQGPWGTQPSPPWGWGGGGVRGEERLKRWQAPHISKREIGTGMGQGEVLVVEGTPQASGQCFIQSVDSGLADAVA